MGALGSVDLAGNSPGKFSANGGKVVVKGVTAGVIQTGSFEEFTLNNSFITTHSVVYGAFVGETPGVITGSLLTVATTGAGTASVQIHNHSNAGTIAADSPFTASFVVL